MKNAGKLSILLPLSIGFCATVLAVAGGLSANVAYANEANEASAASAANLNEVHGNKKESNSSQEEADKYPTVTFMNGDSTIATVQVKKGNSTGSDTPSNIEDTGNTFLGWSTIQGATEKSQVNFSADTPVSANTTVYAVFKSNADTAQKVSVTFKIDGASVNTARVEKGKSLSSSMPSAPSKTGYKFVGWSTTDVASEANFTADTAVSSDKTVYAVFKRDIVMLTVTFKSSRDNSVIQKIQVERGEKVTSTPSVDAPVGYKFVKWCAREDGNATAFDFSKKITKDISIYAFFKTKPGVPEPTPTPIPDVPPILPPNPDRPDPDDPLNPGGGSTQKYSVTFMNGDNVISAVNVERGETVKRKDIPENPQRDGYTFLGWSTHADASDRSDVNFYAGSPVNSDTTVYAVFEKITPVMYDVTFKNDNAWLSTIYVEKGKKLDSDRFPANPTKTGYDFVGWSTNKNASAADFSANSEITEDKIIYAVFKAKSYESSHDVVFKNDGARIKTVTVKDGETVTETNMPSAPSKTGYKFIGWNTQSNATTSNFSATTAITADTTVYAVFVKDEHTEKVEVLVAKMTYTGSSDLAFNTTKKTSDPVDGKKITNGEGKVTLNTPATDGVTEVGNKEITYEDITPGITYEADSSLAYNTTKETEGTKGTRKIEKFYGVDSTTGAIGSLGGSNSEITIKAINKVVKVGNVEKITTPIKFKTEYKADANTPYNTQVTETEGRDGESTTTKTYVVDASTGALSNPTTSTHETKATNKVVKVGNVKKKTSDIDFKTTYVADSSLDYQKQENKTEGQNGKEEIALTYKVDAAKGLTKDVESKKSLCTKPVDYVIRVGNVDTKLKVIEFTTEYIDDDSLAEGTERITTRGQNGSEKVVTTYKVDPTNGLTTQVEKTETKDHKDPVKQVVRRGTKKNPPKPPKPPQPDPDPNPDPDPSPDPSPDPNPDPSPDPNPDPNPEPDPTDPDDNNGGGSIDPDWTYNPELNIGSGNDDNSSTNSNGSMNASANGSDSTSSFDALQAEGTRSADALPNTGSNASGTTFASFGAMVLGLFSAGVAANRKRAKHLR